MRHCHPRRANKASEGRGSRCATRLALGVSAAALVLAASVHAQDSSAFNPPPFTCETWIAAKPQFGQPRASAGARHLAWVMDFIAAHDREPDRDYYGGKIDLTDGVEGGEITAWMDGYCGAHPRDALADAAAALVRDLEARWLTSHGRQNGR
ncbi:MAG TPA: hypothetical protein VG798_01020 [Rhizomicrobium sp.]|nr:hypothetical protein [Rhizomicrobium sp.]